MKNQLMKQAKKSFSLFLAVLMLMSCWVWIAPDKAEAGAPSSYDVVITTGSDNMNACEDTHRIVFTHADGSTTEKNWANAQNEVAGNETFTLTKWPKSIYFQVGSKNVAKARVTRVTINGIEISAAVITFLLPVVFSGKTKQSGQCQQAALRQVRLLTGQHPSMLTQ